MSPQEALWQQLQQQQPASLLLCSDELPTALDQWCQEQNCQLTHIQTTGELEGLARFDLVLILQDWLQRLDDPTQPLARLRNLHTHKIWLLTAANQQQPDLSLLALGFTREQFFEEQQLACYGYNLDRYNRRREWNSPKHWANPENWGKYWW